MRLIATLLLLITHSLVAQTYQAPSLTSVSQSGVGNFRSVTVGFRAGSVATPTITVHYGGAKTFSRTAVATTGSSSITIATPIPLNPGEHYQLQAVEFSDTSGNTLYTRSDTRKLAPGEVRRSFYSNTAGSHSINFELADIGPTLGSTFGGLGKAVNLSTRGFVGSGDQAMVVGIVVRNGTRTFLFRAVGPALGAFGVTGFVPDPRIELRNEAGALIESNDDWATNENAPLFSATMRGVGAFGLTERDAAVRATLPPGNYTLVITGKDGGTGIALAEAYELF